MRGKALRAAAAAGLCLLLAGCGQLSGSYSCGQEGADVFTFTGKDTLTLTCYDMVYGCTYERKGDELIVRSELFGTIAYSFATKGEDLIIDGVTYSPVA